MMTRKLSAVAGAGALLALAACGGNTMDTLGQVLGSAPGVPAGGQGTIAVEVQSVNAQQQLIQVATEDGQVGNVRYDGNTVVVYRDQQYPVTALEYGDLVRMQVQDVQGTLYVSRVDVQQSVQDRTDVGGRVVQVSGTVAHINHDAGTFVLQTPSGNFAVNLPDNPTQAMLNTFHGLRNGNTVRLEGTNIAQGRLEVRRFL
jgi:hypothetical protein